MTNPAPPYRFFGKAAAVLLLLVTIPSFASGQILSVLSVGGSELRDLRVPIGADPANPCIILTCSSARLKPREVGIFRLGFAVQAVLQGLELKILDAGQGGVWAAELSRFLSGDNFLRFFTAMDFRLSDKAGNNLLSARRGHVVRGGKALQLDKVTVRNASGDTTDYPVALLLLNGGHAGCLTLPEQRQHYIPIAELITGS